MDSDSKNYRPTVLIVDDESTIADTLTEILNQNGYEATAAYDGEEAIETALVKPPHMLISDVMLPGMNGIELATIMRRIFPECKVLLFSGHTQTSEFLLSSTNGSGHHFELLSKPIHPADLLKRLATTLQN
jgi:DNA-binding response OmpR family regulator